MVSVRSISLNQLLEGVKIIDLPDLKISNSFFSIDKFFYKRTVINKLLSRNNFFYWNPAGPSTIFTLSNLKRFSKKNYKEFIYIKGKKRNENKQILNKLNE
jgi:hypothetical protein